MSYDEKLADRVSKTLTKIKGVTTKKMFGGLCFLVHGNMLCGVTENKLIARVGPEKYPSALKRKHACPMTFTGRPLKGMIYVLPEGLKTSAGLSKWIELSLNFVGQLPPK